jgi:hypothetical protein
MWGLLNLLYEKRTNGIKCEQNEKGDLKPRATASVTGVSIVLQAGDNFVSIQSPAEEVESPHDGTNRNSGNVTK